MFRLRHYLVTPGWASYRFSGKKHKTDRYPSLEGHRPKFLGSRRGFETHLWIGSSFRFLYTIGWVSIRTRPEDAHRDVRQHRKRVGPRSSSLNSIGSRLPRPLICGETEIGIRGY